MVLMEEAMQHVNLFGYAENTREVYKVMQSHMKRDSRIFSILCIIAGLGFLHAADVGASQGWGALIFGLVSALFALIYFIDNSNRNFHLHTIDWIEARLSNDEKP
jgi:hypothetical protein